MFPHGEADSGSAFRGPAEGAALQRGVVRSPIRRGFKESGLFQETLQAGQGAMRGIERG